MYKAFEVAVLNCCEAAGSSSTVAGLTWLAVRAARASSHSPGPCSPGRSPPRRTAARYQSFVHL